MDCVPQEIIELIALHWPAHNVLSRTCQRMAKWALTARKQVADDNVETAMYLHTTTRTLPNGRFHDITTSLGDTVMFEYGRPIWRRRRSEFTLIHELDDALYVFSCWPPGKLYEIHASTRTHSRTIWRKPCKSLCDADGNPNWPAVVLLMSADSIKLTSVPYYITFMHSSYTGPIIPWSLRC